jgi:thiamine biosynthesis protein ThiI
VKINYIAHYAEIGLKGGNRFYFERILMENMRRSLNRQLPGVKVQIKKISKRFLLHFEDDAPRPAIEKALSSVFGLVHFGFVHLVPTSIGSLEEKCLSLLADEPEGSFAIETKRAFKKFPLTSPQLNEKIGASVVEAQGRKVSLTNPDITCHIEVLEEESYIYTTKYKGAGGLPVGSNGRALCLMSGGIDSPVAAYFIMKRGAHCDFIHFHSWPFTEQTAQEKVKDLIRILNGYQFKARLYMVPFAETQKEIVFKCPESMRVILYRRFMMRIAERVALRRRLKAIVTGESLGQVASQTLENLGAIGELVQLPVLRPLIGLDKNEIISIARRIGTYEVSIIPHDDACTRFMPRHPEIHARLFETLEAERDLDIDSLVERDIRSIEMQEI